MFGLPVNHDEFDPSDEGLDVNIQYTFSTFEEAFELINQRYPWYCLYLSNVNADYRDHIIEKLMENLNGKVEPFEVRFLQNILEEALKIGLSYKNGKKPGWSYKKKIG